MRQHAIRIIKVGIIQGQADSLSYIKMTVRVLFFGATAEAANAREIEISLASQSTAADLIDELSATNIALRNYKLLFSVNQEYAPPSTILNQDDEVAVFTPVSGG